MRISDWSSDVCSSDLTIARGYPGLNEGRAWRTGQGGECQRITRSTVQAGPRKHEDPPKRVPCGVAWLPDSVVRGFFGSCLGVVGGVAHRILRGLRGVGAGLAELGREPWRDRVGQYVVA